LLIGNKAEDDYDEIFYKDIYKLGFGDPLMISAEHGDGLHDLLKKINDQIPE
jgi:GTP-binding protein